MTEKRAVWLLRWAAVLTALGLAFMLWSLLAPTALPVVLAMSVGQGFGTLAFVLYLWVVVTDLRAGRVRAPAEGEADGKTDSKTDGKTDGKTGGAVADAAVAAAKAEPAATGSSAPRGGDPGAAP